MKTKLLVKKSNIIATATNIFLKYKIDKIIVLCSKKNFPSIQDENLLSVTTHQLFLVCIF